MKIGVFDSGLGGLIILKSLVGRFPEYDFAYFGDTANLPYGARSNDIIYGHTRRAMDYLFGVQNAALVIVACNTATIAALRRLQREYLPARYPDRRILGVVVPTVEAAGEMNLGAVGLVATAATIRSGVYAEELAKRCGTRVVGIATPLIVPLVENGGDKYAPEIIADYLKGFGGAGIEALILGCTHYPFYKKLFAELSGLPVISQDEIIPDKLADYLSRHPEIETRLARNGALSLAVSDLNDGYLSQAARIFGREIKLDPMRIE